MDARIIEMAGQKFGRLSVVSMSMTRTADKRIAWNCVCECGAQLAVGGKALRGGHTQSCGCLQKDAASRANRTHGASKSVAEYRVWKEMRQRCENPANASFDRYGGRGITVSADWAFWENFIRDMGMRPSGAYSIDRIDNDGPYSKENCRWATPAQQGRNKRDTVVDEVTLQIISGFVGLGFSIPHAARAVGISRDTVYKALHA